MELKLPSKLLKSLEREASDARIGLHAHILKKLDSITPPVEYIDAKVVKDNLPKLVALLNRLPAVLVVSQGVSDDYFWWVKFDIDRSHPLAWHVVQNLGFVLNYISIEERLPTVFMPVSPPPYLNGGPEFLSWVVESKYNYIDPGYIAQEMENRLPSPIDDAAVWQDA